MCHYLTCHGFLTKKDGGDPTRDRHVSIYLTCCRANMDEAEVEGKQKVAGSRYIGYYLLKYMY